MKNLGPRTAPPLIEHTVSGVGWSRSIFARSNRLFLEPYILRIISLIHKIETCSVSFRRFKCGSCSHHFKRAISTCENPYCFKCSQTRFRKNLGRLKKTFRRCDRVYHFVIGFPRVPSHERPPFSRHHEIMTRWVGYMRRRGYPLIGLRVRDTTVSEDGLFWHYHFAVKAEKCYEGRFKFRNSVYDGYRLVGDPFFNTTIEKFSYFIKKASDGELLIVKGIGFRSSRSKSKFLKYLARRQSCQFGHDDHSSDVYKSGLYGFAHIMSALTYLMYIDNTRRMVWLGGKDSRIEAGLSSISAPDDESDGRPHCPKCGSGDIIELDSDLIGGGKPPPDYGGYQNVFG